MTELTDYRWLLFNPKRESHSASLSLPSLICTREVLDSSGDFQPRGGLGHHTQNQVGKKPLVSFVKWFPSADSAQHKAKPTLSELLLSSVYFGGRGGARMGAAVGKAGTLVQGGPPRGLRPGREESHAGPFGERLVACAARRKTPSSSRGMQTPVWYQARPGGGGNDGQSEIVGCVGSPEPGTHSSQPHAPSADHVPPLRRWGASL